MNGLTGYIEQAGFPFDCVEWGKEDFNSKNETPGWWVYEQTAYWLDGFLKSNIVPYRFGDEDNPVMQKICSEISEEINESLKENISKEKESKRRVTFCAPSCIRSPTLHCALGLIASVIFLPNSSDTSDARPRNTNTSKKERRP